MNKENVTNNRQVYLKRRATFCAAHRLHSPYFSDEENRRLFDKCNNKNGHGHNYEVFVVLKGTPTLKTGMVMNLVDVTHILQKEIVDKVDHFHLNYDVEMFKGIIPSVENMVIVFWDILKDKFPEGLLYEVKVVETENNQAIYRGE